MNNRSSSQELSPSEIKNRDFKKTMLGYSPEEVVGFLDQVAKLWQKIQKREKDFVAQIEKLESCIKAWETREADLEKIKAQSLKEAQSILDEAQKSARDLIQDAEKRALDVRKNTESWLAQVLQDVEEVEKQKIGFETALRAALDSHYEILKKGTEGGSSLGAKLYPYLKQSAKNPSQQLSS